MHAELNENAVTPERIVEAAKRLRTGNYRETDLLVIRVAYLREHPADEFDPITDDVLVAHGFVYDDETEGHMIYCYQGIPLIYGAAGRSLWEYGGRRIKPPQTVSQLRRLLVALDAQVPGMPNAATAASVKPYRPIAGDKFPGLEIGRKREGYYWVRVTSDRGLYYWLHPERNEWIGEPEQITMPGFPTYAEADEARKLAPVPTFD